MTEKITFWNKLKQKLRPGGRANPKTGGLPASAGGELQPPRTQPSPPLSARTEDYEIRAVLPEPILPTAQSGRWPTGSGVVSGSPVLEIAQARAAAEGISVLCRRYANDIGIQEAL